MRFYGTCFFPKLHDYMDGGFILADDTSVREAASALAEAVENFVVCETLVRPWIEDMRSKHPSMHMGIDTYQPGQVPRIKAWPGTLHISQLDDARPPYYRALNAIVQAQNADKVWNCKGGCPYHQRGDCSRNKNNGVECPCACHRGRIDMCPYPPVRPRNRA